NARAHRAGSSSHQATIATRGPMSAPRATMQHTRRPRLAAHSGFVGCFLRPGEGRRAVVAAERLVIALDDAAPIGDERVAVPAELVRHDGHLRRLTLHQRCQLRAAPVDGLEVWLPGSVLLEL